jgi:hypothetical protein
MIQGAFGSSLTKGIAGAVEQRKTKKPTEEISSAAAPSL